MIGWVPRAENERFQRQELVFGRVDFVGSVPGSETWGARVSAQPALLPAHVSPFPWQLLSGSTAAAVQRESPASSAGRAAAAPRSAPSSSVSGGAPAAAAAVPGPDRLQRAVGPQQWQRWSEAAEQRSRGLCEVTGASPVTVPLELVPIWQYNDQTRVAKVRPRGVATVICPLHPTLLKPHFCMKWASQFT